MPAVTGLGTPVSVETLILDDSQHLPIIQYSGEKKLVRSAYKSGKIRPFAVLAAEVGVERAGGREDSEEINMLLHSWIHKTYFALSL